jgi:hypothetical protein
VAKPDHKPEKPEKPPKKSPGCHWLDTLAELFHCPSVEPESMTMVMVIGPPQPRQPLKGSIDMAATEIALGPNQQVDITLMPKDAAQQPVSFDGPVTWESSDPTISDVRVYDAATGLKACVGSFPDVVGVAVITATGDRRKGPETILMVGNANVTVSKVEGDVETVDFEVSEPIGRLEINPLK